ncbi:hypothetical protein LPJ53_005876 [Coemansia erecta]|uniref:Uncharacterized protein n=1 Tax=Coemansia erecta TaxID=147472 RepID=A0A9W7XWJ4_9FUNG|nr:hypothetical protein LPJ53_005876 [Coemansia erecta]
MLATCSSLTDQLKIIDLRAPISPVLSYGKPLVSEYPEEIVPAGNPYNGMIVAPYNRQQTGGQRDQLTVFNTRFTGFLETGPTEHGLLNTGSLTVSFDTEQGIGFPTMVITGHNGTLGSFDHMDF